MKFRKPIPRDGFFRAAAALTTGSALAQLLPMLASPLLARLYTPGELGAYALFVSTLNLTGQLACLKYDLALIVAPGEGQASGLLRLSLSLCAGVSLLLLPLGIITWALFLESGIHATISGVVLGFLVPVKMSARSEAAQAEHGLAEVLEHRFRPLSTGICVPIFAFFSAGVAVGGFEGLGRALTDSVAVGIMVALVAGKTLGIFGTTWLVTRFKNANLDPDVAWIDVIGLAATGGIGFTVSLLVAELSFPHGSAHTEDAKIAILVGSVLAAIVGAAILSRRNKHYRALAEKESVDADDNGIPDVFEGTYRDPKAESNQNS